MCLVEKKCKAIIFTQKLNQISKNLKILLLNSQNWTHSNNEKFKYRYIKFHPKTLINIGCNMFC